MQATLFLSVTLLPFDLTTAADHVAETGLVQSPRQGLCAFAHCLRRTS